MAEPMLSPGSVAYTEREEFIWTPAGIAELRQIIDQEIERWADALALMAKWPEDDESPAEAGPS